jgi:LCP family protein required for cell wall assembly
VAGFDDDELAAGRLPLPPELSPRGRRGDRRSRRRRWVRITSWAAVVASVLVLGLSGAAFGYYEHLNGNIHRIPLVISGTHRPAKPKDGAENILIVGDDSRVGETPAEVAQDHATLDGGANNTDTIIILHLAPNNGPATLVSIPRDSWVPIPGHGYFKINAAYADGEAEKKGDGPELLTETVEDLTGLHIDHFISVGLTQFVNISNAIGGVKVCISTAGGAHEPLSGIDLPYGVSTISGSQALAFVRQRHDLPEGDIDRIHRQQRFITAVEQKAESTKNPATINQVLETATRSLTVDTGLSGLGLLDLADRLRSLPPADIRFATVPITTINGSVDYNGQELSIVELDMTKLKTFFANLQAERDPNAPAPTPTPTVSPATPEQTTLTVENGSGVNGAAGRTQASLESYGFQVPSVGTVGITAATTIDYNPADAAEAAELARSVPGATLTSDASLTAGTIELILGSSFSGVRSPTTVSTSTPTSSPAPTSSTSTGTGTTSAANVGTSEIDGVPCGP